MAIEYTFMLDTSMKSDDVIHLLADGIPLAMENSGDLLFLSTPGIVCHVLSQTDLGRELAMETFGISTSVKIVCQLDKFDFHDAGMDIVTWICLFLLLESSYDILLVSNGERGLLLRKSGKIVADCRDPFWKAKWKAIFANSGIQFEEGSLPIL